VTSQQNASTTSLPQPKKKKWKIAEKNFFTELTDKCGANSAILFLVQLRVCLLAAEDSFVQFLFA